MRCRLPLAVLLACASGLWFTVAARAVFMVLTPLNGVVDKQQFIFMAKVKEVLPDKPAMVLEVAENLKGKVSFERMPVNLAGDKEAAKGKHTEVMLDRIDKDVPIIICASFNNPKYVAFCFTNGTWFQMEGRIDKQDGQEVVRWTFLHCEPYLRRTFKGTTEELKQVIADALAKKKEPPPPNDKEPPGFGPPIKKNSGVSHPLAVIQLPLLSLIAALAALFPTVFGGLAIFMKRWVAALSTSGLVSVFVMLPMLAPSWCGNLWVYSASGLWLTCGAMFALGALWSLRRYRKSFDAGTENAMQPGKFDRLVLGILFAAAAIAVGIGLGFRLPVWSNEYWRWVLAGGAGFGVGSYYLLSSYLRKRSPLRVPGEAVLLWAVVGCCIAFGSWEAGKYSRHGQTVATGAGGIGQPSLNVEPIWQFAPEVGGMVVSSCATPERIYVAVMVVEGFTRFGRVYALDPETGKEVWRFDNDFEKDSDKGMKPAFSAPIYANERLYFGEGLHTDTDSRLFSLEAATGKKLWEYKTESHTESSPAILDGRVVFGAGFDGLHCLDAITGEFKWRYPKEGKAETKPAHVDCNPFIVDGRVYAGSGYNPDYVKENGKINTIFCLDLKTGAEIWKERVEDAVYGSPLVHEGKAYFGTGNSTYNQTIASKHPGILCRDAATGKVIWDRALPENVMGRPAADRNQLFVGCLDGKGYSLDLQTGRINWSVAMGGPVLAGPIVDLDRETATADAVYFASKLGTLTAIAPYAPNYARVFWSAPLSYWTQQPVDELSATPTLVRTEDDNEVRRRLFVGFGQGRAGATVPRLLCIEDLTKKK